MDRASKPVPEQAFEPLQTFDSCEDAIESAKQLASIQGYSLAIQRRTKNSEDVVSSVRLRCSKAFKYTPYDAGTHPSKKRRTKTSKVSCPFRLLVARDDQNRWLITPSPNAGAREHSHDPDKFGSFAADRGKIVRRHAAYILTQWNSRVKIFQILAGLRQTKDRDTWVLRGQDIANFLRAHDRARLGGRTSIEWLIDELRETHILSQPLALMMMAGFNASSSLQKAASIF
ncbi:hypothetical protein E4U39_003035 [Claviceps sp. Clav50 group G5]|nr:hypothetical protein E4U39_003035 [Claviceps sp. Clav50 group G5]